MRTSNPPVKSRYDLQMHYVQVSTSFDGFVKFEVAGIIMSSILGLQRAWNYSRIHASKCMESAIYVYYL